MSETRKQRAERIKNEAANGSRNGQAQPVEEVEFEWVTAAELAAQIPDDPIWRADGLLCDGSLSELDGKAKRSGKTTFLLAMSACILEGKPFLGRPTVSCPIVYLTEQTGSSFRKGLQRAGLLERDDFHILPWAKTRGASWPSVVLGAVRRAIEVGAHVLIVDTLAQFCGLIGDAENDAGAALEAVRPLQEAAANTHPLAIMLSRHDRKSGGDVGDSGRGSSAFTGAVDIVLALRRPEGQGDGNVRLLLGLSRYDETPPKKVIAFNGSGYDVRGDDEMVNDNRVLDKVLRALPIEPDQAMTVGDLIKATQMKRAALQRALNNLQLLGWLGLSGAGKKNDPKRYFRLLEKAPGQASEEVEEDEEDEDEDAE